MAGDAPLTPQDILGSALPGILDRARVVVTPYPFGVSDADFLRVVVFNSLPGVSIEIHGRQAAPGLDAKPFRLEMTPTSDRQATTRDFTIGGGFVTNISVFASGATPLIGQTFVIVQLVRSAGATAFIMGTLLQGYVTARQNLGWPGSPIESSIEGGGAFRVIAGTTPGVGAEIVETCPTGARWELLSVLGTLTTTAAAGNRGPGLRFEQAGETYFLSGSPQSSPPSSAFAYSWAVGMPLSVAVGFVGGVGGILVPNRVLSLSTFKTTTSNLQPGDQWSNVAYLVQEWLEAQ